MTGSPASITPSEPGSTQSGRPMTSVAAQAVTPTDRRRCRPEAERLADRKPAAVQDRRNRRRVPAGGDRLQHADQLARLLRAAVRVLRQARHDQLGQGGRHVGADDRTSRGVSDMCAASSRAGVLPWNGGRPAISSYAITPNA